jgi:hypothetical protein
MKYFVSLALFATVIAGIATPGLSRAQGMPPQSSAQPEQQQPPHDHNHGGAGAGHASEEPELLQDSADIDLSLPQGTVSAQLLDERDQPLANMGLELVILESTVAKGDKSQSVRGTTNTAGVATFPGLARAAGLSYRITVNKQGATFASPPVQLPITGGVRIRQHVYPVETDFDKATVIFQSGFYTEIKDDRVQFEQAIGVYNAGKTAWLPLDFEVKLPEGFTAFTPEKGAGDVGVVETKKGYKFKGTFPPGKHEVTFRFQLPYGGENTVEATVGLPPHMALMRVISAAAPTVLGQAPMTLEVAGFPQPRLESDGEGQRALITEKQGRRDQELRSIELKVSGIPETGLPKSTVRGIAMAAIVAALAMALWAAYTAFGAKDESEEALAAAKKRAQKANQSDILEELYALEQAKRKGDVGEKTYERMKRELMDALAVTFAEAKTG